MHHTTPLSEYLYIDSLDIIDILGLSQDPHTPCYPSVRVSLDSLDTIDIPRLSQDPHTPY